MLTPYPLKPVITENFAFSILYDEDPESLNLVSACLRPEEARRLLDQGAEFSSMLFLDGAGEELISKLKQDGPAGEKKETFPEIVELVLQRHDAEGVAKVHAVLGAGGIKTFFAAGG